MHSNTVTETQLNSKTKADLISMCLTLQGRLEAASAGPTTPAEIERRNLDLQKQVILVKEAAEKRAADHQERLAQIEADKELALKELDLKYNSTLGVDASQLQAMYDQLEETARKAAEELSFGLKEAEVEAKAKLEEIQEKVKEAEAEAELKTAEARAAVTTAVAESKATVENIKTNHKREMEQLAYDNSLAIRDQNLDAATKIAAKYGKVLILTSELTELQEREALEQEEIQGLIDDAVKAKSSEIYATEGAKYGKLRAETEQEIALLKKDKEYLTQEKVQMQARIDALETQVKEHPDKIAAAVAAARSEVVVNQDATGKR
jgi:sirohydrochlorin ferrochelatase